MGLKQVSFVERSSLSQRVPYRRFHCVHSNAGCPITSVQYLGLGERDIVGRQFSEERRAESRRGGKRFRDGAGWGMREGGEHWLGLGRSEGG